MASNVLHVGMAAYGYHRPPGCGGWRASKMRSGDGPEQRWTDSSTRLTRLHSTRSIGDCSALEIRQHARRVRNLSSSLFSSSILQPLERRPTLGLLTFLLPKTHKYKWHPIEWCKQPVSRPLRQQRRCFCQVPAKHRSLARLLCALRWRLPPATCIDDEDCHSSPSPSPSRRIVILVRVAY